MKKYTIYLRLVTIVLLFLPLLNYSQTQTGVNTKAPKATLDVNGDLIVRDLPIIKEKEAYYAIGHDSNNRIVSLSREISSYSTYLGYSPMAAAHKEELPFVLENGYITTIEGFSIGACYGVMINFTITFIGTKYIGTKLQGISTANNNKYAEVTLSSGETVFGTPLEILAKASSCGANSGHTLSFNTQNNKISVSFLDKPTYYSNAGIFVINKVIKIKQTS